MDYAAYLKSPKWKAIRARVMRRDRGRCRSCGRRAWQVHHDSYDRATMDGQTLEHLFAICGSCHLAATFTVTGARRPPGEVAEMGAALRQPAASQKRRKPRRAGKRKGRKKGQKRAGHLTPAQLRAFSLWGRWK